MRTGTRVFEPNHLISIGKESDGAVGCVRSHFLSFVCEFWCSCLSRERRQNTTQFPPVFLADKETSQRAQVHATEMASCVQSQAKGRQGEDIPVLNAKIVSNLTIPYLLQLRCPDDILHLDFHLKAFSFAEIFAKPETSQFW